MFSQYGNDNEMYIIGLQTVMYPHFCSLTLQEKFVEVYQVFFNHSASLHLCFSDSDDSTSVEFTIEFKKTHFNLRAISFFSGNIIINFIIIWVCVQLCFWLETLSAFMLFIVKGVLNTLWLNVFVRKNICMKLNTCSFIVISPVKLLRKHI